MLDAAVRTRIREYLDAELGPRDQTLGIAFRDRLAKFSRSGNLQSSRCVLAVALVGCEELTVRAEIVWQAIKRSHASMVSRPDEQTLDGLKQQIAEHVTNQAKRIAAQACGRVKFGGTKWHGTIKDQINERCREMRAKLTIEAQFYVDELEQVAGDRESDGRSAPTFNAPIGVVQIGDYATANVSFQAQDAQQFAEALETFRASLADNREILSEQRDQADELAEQLLVAVRAEKPNPPMIAGLFGALGQVVRTVASIRPAWEALRDVAIAIGMMLR